ncbi:MAG: hypothetical protein K8F34_02955 [Candidatus Kuenenia stuttgartiensis]|nr:MULTISPECIES: DUF6602 domain-containing protein [Kuenenia]MBZ0190636.1 hypothetical protein [Candidatus Kuenenia stuttgartiensis]MCZ7622679.1 hypothetical protein [Candidatus Kuenenia sp.]
MHQEEKAILLSVDRALSSSSNSQTIGSNGELPLIQFFNRYLPLTLKATTGYFITPSGILSPQIDIIIFDSRYPLLSENTDGSVLTMLHSVIACIEVKTNLKSSDIKKAWTNSIKIMQLASEIEGYGTIYGWQSILNSLIAYRCRQTLDTIKNVFKSLRTNPRSNLLTNFSIEILRIPEKKQSNKFEFGGSLHFEPYKNSNKDSAFVEFLPTFAKSYSPLSDFYYRTVYDCYYTLGRRNYSYNEIGWHFTKYMSWATASVNLINK